MPDIPNRRDEEAALAAILSSVFARYESELTRWFEENHFGDGDPAGRAAGGTPRLPAGFLDEFRSEVEAALLTTLAGIHREGTERLAEQFATVPETTEKADAYAEQRAREIAMAIATRIDREVSQASSTLATVAASAALLGGAVSIDRQREIARSAVSRTVGPARPDIIATTEITAANTAGEFEAMQQIERETGLVMLALWQTEQDDRVCYACQRRHNTVVDGQEDGPPLHVNCRCFVEYSFN